MNSPRADAAGVLLEALLARADEWRVIQARVALLDGARAVGADAALQAIADYHAVARDLAVARRLTPDSAAREYLESTYAQLHAVINRPAIHAGYEVWSLFRDRLPATVAALRSHIGWVTLLFISAALAGWWLIAIYPTLIGVFASPEMIAIVERGELWTDGLLNVVPSSVLATQILTNNITVSLFAFALGAVFGLGTFYIIGLNGLMLGAIFSFTHQHGMAGRLFEFVVAHGVVEISCLCLSGAAGAAVGAALVRPDSASRAESLARAARLGSPLMVIVVLLLLGCGLIEGFVSPNPDVPAAARIVIGFGYFVLMIALLRGWLFGRSRGTSEVLA